MRRQNVERYARNAIRMASTGHENPALTTAAKDLFDCAVAFADEQESVDARRALLDAALALVKDAYEVARREGCVEAEDNALAEAQKRIAGLERRLSESVEVYRR